MDAKKMTLAWNPNSDEVTIGPHPDLTGWSNKYRFTTFAVYSHFSSLNFEERKKMIFIQAVILIIRDKVDPVAVHKALLALDEYNDGLPDDVPGVRHD